MRNILPELKQILKEKLRGLPPIEMHENEVKIGVDALSVCAVKRYGQVIDETYEFFLTKRQIDIEYDEMCQAFFDVTDELGKVTIITYD